ncbi:CDP-glycerol glycerophosphotransferase family protein [bacterium]|nr:CDP-glycerol glycerophosphotransferase family protein [bacterium]
MIKVLFDLKKEYYLNSLYPLYRELAADPDYDLHIRIGSDQKRVLGVFMRSGRERIAGNLREQGFSVTGETAGFDLVVCGDALNKPERFGDTVRVHLDHGVGIKTLRIRNIVRQQGYHYHVFLEGRYWYDYIAGLGWENKADFHITGIPKLDPLFWEGYYDKKALTVRLGLDPAKKTVLFAPSYKPSCIGFVQERIMDLVDDFNLVVKLHPYSWGGKYAPHGQHRFYERLARRHADVFLIPEHDFDIYPYLDLADTMISDTSSVINEFLALGKFGIIYVLPYEKLNHSDGMPVLSIDPEEWLAGAFPHIHRPDELRGAVEQALHPTPDMERRLEQHRAYFFTGLDGGASKRVKAEIDRIMKEGG